MATTEVIPDDRASRRTRPQTGEDRSTRRALMVSGTAALLAVSALLVAAVLVKNDGHFAYALDDAAIHQSMARQLLHHGTWGVSEGEYASASSSPGWTLLLTAATGLLPFARDLLPLFLNLAAGVAVIGLFARDRDLQSLVRHSNKWLVGAAMLLAVSFLWFLPALAFVGMEHVLHAALVLLVLVLLDRLQGRPLVRPNTWPYLLALGLATLVRYESAFLAAGCAIALLLGTTERFGVTGTYRWSRGEAMRLAFLSVVVAAAPIIICGGVNLLFHESFLPNSIVAKSALQSTSGLDLLRPPRQVISELGTDPALLALVVLALGYLVLSASGGARRSVSIAVVFVTATLLHASLADFGWYERYQAYLVVAGSFVAVHIAAEVVSPQRRSAVLWIAVLLIPLLSPVRVALAKDVPLAASNTYRQRYQMGVFLQEYYQGRGFLTGELGYTTYLHDGPVVDILGLGSHEVLTARQREGDTVSATTVERLVRENDVAVMTVYSGAAGTRGFGWFEVPADWILVGEWQLEERVVSAPDEPVQFYAPNEQSAAELDHNLRDFGERLPSGVKDLDREELLERYIESLDRNGS